MYVYAILLWEKAGVRIPLIWMWNASVSDLFLLRFLMRALRFFLMIKFVFSVIFDRIAVEIVQHALSTNQFHSPIYLSTNKIGCITRCKLERTHFSLRTQSNSMCAWCIDYTRCIPTKQTFFHKFPGIFTALLREQMLLNRKTVSKQNSREKKPDSNTKGAVSVRW